jgi:hypothetical protein
LTLLLRIEFRRYIRASPEKIYGVPLSARVATRMHFTRTDIARHTPGVREDLSGYFKKYANYEKIYK